MEQKQVKNTRRYREKEANYKNNQSNRSFASKHKKLIHLNSNNFEAREYDYDSLEKKLLGWDKDD